MTIFTSHALDEMERSEITKEEVERCLVDGDLTVKQVVKGEMRYGRQLELKDKKLVVIYTIENDKEKVITCYPIRRKKWWKE